MELACAHCDLVLASLTAADAEELHTLLQANRLTRTTPGLSMMWVMAGERLMSIGEFAQQSGLSVPALRYYAEIELLVPASVDPSSGYRRHHPRQLVFARQIYILRALELRIEAVREVVSGIVGLLRQCARAGSAWSIVCGSSTRSPPR